MPSPRHQHHNAVGIRLLNVSGAALALFWAIDHAYHGYPVVIATGFALTAAVYLTGTTRRRIPRHGEAATALLLVSVWLGALGTGGIHADAAAWLVVFPFLAVVSGTHRSVRPFFIASAVAILALLIADIAGWTPLGHRNMNPLETSVVYLSAIFVVSAGSMSYARSIRRSLNRTRAVNAQLTQEVDDHRTTQAALRDAHQQLVTTAHSAGMAEVAIGVLHNVGNGLNAANVSAALVVERLQPTTPDRLRRLAARLVEGDPTTLTPQKIARYAEQLAEQADREHHAIHQEMASLRSSLEHVKEIVQNQQALAKRVGLQERVEIQHVVEQAASLALTPESSRSLHVRLDNLRGATGWTDRHKLLQILTNLLKNAAEASGSAGSGSIEVFSEYAPHHLLVHVRDRGAGMDRNTQRHLFQHGFTTKPDGHGFGLHMSVLAARELGGDLTGFSPGLGKGSTFTLSLPTALFERATPQATERSTGYGPNFGRTAHTAR